MNRFPLLLLVCLCAGRTVGGPVTFYVAPEGDDHWSGKRASANHDRSDGPLATLPAALERSRQARRASAGHSSKIVLRGGVYVLERPLVLLPEDSGLVIAAWPRENPIITSEVRVGGWRPSSVKTNTWQAEIPAARGGAWIFHELFVNGRRAPRARLPAAGFYRTATGPIPNHPDQIQANPGDINPDWAAHGDVELVLLPAWEQTRNQIRSFLLQSNIVTLAGVTMPYASEPHTRYYIENAPNVLASGQWHLDTNYGTLTYCPASGEDVAVAEVTAPRLDELIRLHGQKDTPVRGVVFDRLTFAGTDWPLENGSDIDVQGASEIGAAFSAQWADSCVVQKCLFTRLGGFAMDFGRGCRGNTISGCEMTDLGAGGIRVGEGDPQAAAAAPNDANTITDNHISYIGRVSAPAVGILVFLSASNTIAHNEIDHTYYTAISVGWTWGYAANPCRANLVEHNHLHDIGQGMLSDMGGVYTLGVQPGAVVRNNLIHDVNKFNYGGWGLYTDEGSSGILLENNVVYRCQSAGLHQHYGETNIFRNNIFALNLEAQLARTRQETHISFFFTNNIVYFDSGSLFSGNWSSNGFRIDHNIYFDTRVSPAHPPLDGTLKIGDWQAQGHDVHSLFVDPQFVAPERGDFRLRPGSPAIPFGFNPPDLRDVGVRKQFAR